MSDKQKEAPASSREDQDDRTMEYLQPILSAKESPSLKQWLEDDESRYFMSEPSLSTEGDRTDPQSPSYLLSPQDSLSESSLPFFAKAPSPPPLPNMPQQSAQQTLVSSPGNTSISSRDSPHLHHKVHMQFMQDKRSRLKIESTPNEPVLITRTNAIFPEDDKKEANQSDHMAQSSRSTSSASLGQQQRAADFLQDLKRQSVGALEDAADVPSDFDSIPVGAADRRQIDTVIRRQEGLEVLAADRPGDETVVMVLSESDGELEGGDGLEPLDWEQKHQHSADDEKTLHRPRRTRRMQSGNSKVLPGHRRTRSGDSAAATLMNGGVDDWKGMHHDKLPMPQSRDYEEDSDSQVKPSPQIRKTVSGGASSRPRVKQVRSQSESSIDVPSTGFTIGSLENTNMMAARKARKPPRQRRGPMERNDPHFASFPNVGSNNSSPRNFASPHSSSFPSYGELPTGPQRGASDNSFLTAVQRSAVSPQFFKQTMDVNNEHFMHHLNASFPAPYTSDSSYDGFPPSHARRASSGDVAHRVPGYVERQGDRRSQYGQIASESSFDTMQSRESGFSWISERGSHRPAPFSVQESIAVELAQSKSVQFEDESEEFEARHISCNQMKYSVRDADTLGSTEQLFENKEFRGKAQNVLRSRSPRVESSAKSNKTTSFKPVMNAVDDKSGATFVCPQCGTRQRSFFTASTAPVQLEGPASYLALYFGLYVVASLYIFGLEEGWKGLDCVYFAVITLTTAGLGDLVPTSDSAKIICSIFIYFGVACIGLLLGTYLAGMLDEKNQNEAMMSRVDNCVVCSRVRMIKTREKRRQGAFQPRQTRHFPEPSVEFGRHSSSERATCSTAAHHQQMHDEELEQSLKRRKQHHGNHHPNSTGSGGSYFPESPRASIASLSPAVSYDPHRKVGVQFSSPSSRGLNVINGYNGAKNGPSSPSSPSSGIFPSHTMLGSPMTSQILGRQKHTRHQSFDVGNSNFFATASTPASAGSRGGRARNFSIDVPTRPVTIDEGNAFHSSFTKSTGSHAAWSTAYDDDDEESSEEASADSNDSEISAIINPNSQHSKVKTAKYVFLTLKQALMNSIFIIAIGSVGFYFIEEMTVVDSFYFTTVLLTTVGYGDIAPVTNGGKLFATVYVLGAGTVLLHNMSLISMIPLELRKRRIEKAVLTQFGDQLDDAALRELATGPLVQRLQLSTNRTDGLDECTREMFALAMLVRLGKVTERDVKQTFAMFRRLDVDNEGVLNSRTIITGMMHKRKSMKDLQAAMAEAQGSVGEAASPPPPPEYESAHDGSPPSRYWFGQRGSLHVVDPEARTSFHFADARHDSLEEELEGEQAALLASHSGERRSFAGGTFADQIIDEEEGLDF
jgi:hypothetical protein